MKPVLSFVKLVSAWLPRESAMRKAIIWCADMLLPGNHERDCPDSGDRFGPLVEATDSGSHSPCHRRLLKVKGISIERLASVKGNLEGMWWKARLRDDIPISLVIQWLKTALIDCSAFLWGTWKAKQNSVTSLDFGKKLCRDLELYCRWRVRSAHGETVPDAFPCSWRSVVLL